MQDYETLYYQLFNRVSDIILELQQMQQQVEEEYIGHDEPPEYPVQGDNILPFRQRQSACVPGAHGRPARNG